MVKKINFNFQKEYWLINNGKPAKIECFDKYFDRKKKINKVIDKIKKIKK